MVLISRKILIILSNSFYIDFITNSNNGRLSVMECIDYILNNKKFSVMERSDSLLSLRAKLDLIGNLTNQSIQEKIHNSSKEITSFEKEKYLEEKEKYNLIAQSNVDSIKKAGSFIRLLTEILTYFPMETDFLENISVRNLYLVNLLAEILFDLLTEIELLENINIEDLQKQQSK